MKRIILTVFFSLLANYSWCQGMYGFTAGIGRTTSYTSYTTPAFDAFYLARLSRSLYAGGALTLQKYSFLYSSGATAPAYGDVLSIRQRSAYLYFSPKIDLGLGYRKYVHLNFSLGPGLLLGGEKLITNYEPFYVHVGPNAGSDTVTSDNSSNMRTMIFHYAFGVTERYPLGFFNILLSQEFSYITSKLNYPGTNLNTSYISFTVGIMHKYPQVAVEY